MVILDPYGMTFDPVGVFDLAFHLLFRYCGAAASFHDLANQLNLFKPGGGRLCPPNTRPPDFQTFHHPCI